MAAVNGPRFDEVREQLPIVTAKLEALQNEVAQLTDSGTNCRGNSSRASTGGTWSRRPAS